MSGPRLRASAVMVAGCLALSTLLSADPSTAITTEPVAWQQPSPVATPVTKSAVSAPIAPVIDRALRVRVTANGVAVADAEVSVTDGSRPTLATVVTDREGVARFPDLAPGPYELWARRDASVSKLARIAEPTGEIAMELAPASTLRGAIVGELPRDATVTVIPVDVDHVARVASVDAQGKFAVPGLPVGRWRVESVAPGHVQTGDDVVDVRAGSADVAVRMIRTGIASGVVLDGNGVPVANATIVLRGSGQQATLDDHPTIETSTRRRWVHPLAGRRILPGADILKFGAPRAGVRNPECGQGHCGVDIGWQKGTIVHAAADGEVVAAFSESHGEAGRAIAIDHGDDIRTYYMHLDELRPGLEPGMRVRAGDALGTMGETGAARGPHLHFALTQDRDGRTFYLDPEPILRHAVVLPEARSLDPIDAKDAPVIAAREPAQHVASRSFSTDSTGRFRIDNVAPGSYVAVAFASSLAPGTSTQFLVRSGGETPDIAIAMHPGVAVQGRVIGRDGPVANALIVANAGTGEAVQKVAATRTSAQGDFTLRALSGPITLAVTAPGHGVMERTLTLGDRGPTRREDFTLTIENAQLRGQVLAPDGGPAGKVALRVVDGPTRRQALTDATGRFTIDHAASGTYVLEVVSTDYPTTRITTESDRFTEIRLERGGSAALDLRDTTGMPIANVRVDASSGDRTASITTDARGQATLRGLAPGEWTFRVRARGYAAASRTLAIRASAVPADLRLELARSATIGGIVRDRYGRRVANAKVTADGVSVQTDADGNFRITDAPAGNYWIEAEVDGFRGATSVQLAPGAERQTVDIVIAN